MSPWGWWVDATRKINEARRLIAESLDCRMDVYGTDDEMAEMCRMETPAPRAVHVDPNACGCHGCRAGVEYFRRIVVAQADLNDLQRIGALPAYRGQR